MKLRPLLLLFAIILIAIVVKNIDNNSFQKDDSSPKEVDSFSVETKQLTQETTQPTQQSSESSQLVPILMFHYIRVVDKKSDPLGYGLSVTPTDFELILQTLTAKHYHTIHIDDLLNGKAQKNSIILTFDDGYEDFYTTALPLLKKYNFTASEAIITDKMDGNQFMTPDQVKTINHEGIEILSHTVHHLDLSKTPIAEKEIVDSKNFLEKLLQKPITGFAYPSGKYNNRTIQYLKVAGYKIALTTKAGFADLNGDFYQVHRFRIHNSQEVKNLPNIF